MKQKRTFIAVLLVIAVLALGVAFAATNYNMTITGNAAATASDKNFNVAFTNGQKTDANEANADDGQTITVSDIVAANKAASFKVTGMSTVGDSVEVTFTITNPESATLAAQLGALDVTDVEDKFTCSAVYAGETLLQPGDSTTVVVTVTLDETVTADINAADVISVEFNAEAKQPTA